MIKDERIFCENYATKSKSFSFVIVATKTPKVCKSAQSTHFVFHTLKNIFHFILLACDYSFSERTETSGKINSPKMFNHFKRSDFLFLKIEGETDMYFFAMGESFDITVLREQ